ADESFSATSSMGIAATPRLRNQTWSIWSTQMPTTCCMLHLLGSGLGQNGSPRYCGAPFLDRKSTRLNSSHLGISYAVLCLKKDRLQPLHLPVHRNYHPFNSPPALLYFLTKITFQIPGRLKP